MSEKTEKPEITDKGLAISVNKACKVFESWNDSTVVFSNLSMSVKKGCLYALLGASGCGKTTLLKCIIGRESLDSGEILVFGGVPGSKMSGVPGPRIGYLPQTEGLLNQFTVYETLFYFGLIAGIQRPNIMVKADELINLLELQNPNQVIESLSGGEKRRVSLAISLLHEPELLVLDEPTVGLDPILREIIWDYLINEVRNGVTIIITTHYIEEAKQANIIGLMRKGEILAEKSPSDLLDSCQCDSLELAFLQLSQIQDENIQKNDQTEKDFSEEKNIRRSKNEDLSNLPNPFRLCKYRHVAALVWKNSLWLKRNRLTIVLLIYTVMLTIFLNTAVGFKPNGLKLAVFNGEYPGRISCPFTNSCIPKGLSCWFLDHLGKNKQVLVGYKDRESGKKAVLAGKAWSYLEIPNNFSETFYDGINYGRFSNLLIINGSRLDAFMDMSEYTTGYFLIASFLQKFNEFSSEFAKSCGFSPKAIDIMPLKFEDPIYGDVDAPFKDFLLPGGMLVITFTLMVTLSTGIMLIERKEGIWERSSVLGVTNFEIIISHFIIQHCFNAVTSLIVMSVTLIVFNVNNNGNIIIIFVLLFIAGSVGVAYGTLISCSVDSQWIAVFLTMSTFTPTLLASDIVWPIQGQYFFLQYFTQLMPLTLASQSLRSVILRGWGLEKPSVLFGLLSTSLWVVIMVIATMMVIKLRLR